MILIKTLINNLKRDRGFTLVELILALILFSIIMIGVLTFISFIAETTNFTHENAAIQNEMRLIMKVIRDEVVAAQGIEIGNNIPRSALSTGDSGLTMSLLGFDESNSRRTFNIEHKPAGGTSVEKVWDFNELPYLEANFEIMYDTHNILVITLTNNDPDPRFQLTLTDKLFLPNARRQRDPNAFRSCGQWFCLPCTCPLPPQPPLIISPPGGGNSLLIISPDPAPA